MNNWISVKDRLPEKDESVVVYSYEDKVNNGFYVAWIERFNKDNLPIWQYSWCCGCFVPGKVTHWQPLPKEPKI